MRMFIDLFVTISRLNYSTDYHEILHIRVVTRLSFSSRKKVLFLMGTKKSHTLIKLTIT